MNQFGRISGPSGPRSALIQSCVGIVCKYVGTRIYCAYRTRYRPYNIDGWHATKSAVRCVTNRQVASGGNMRGSASITPEILKDAGVFCGWGGGFLWLGGNIPFFWQFPDSIGVFDEKKENCIALPIRQRKRKKHTGATHSGDVYDTSPSRAWKLCIRQYA